MTLPTLRRALSQTLGSFSTTYWYLWVGTLVNRLGSFVLPFMSLYLTQQRHLGVAEAGLIVSFYGIGSTIAGPVGGALADRIGRRTTLLLGLGAGGTLTILLGLVHALWAIALLTFLVGFIADWYRPAVSAAVADVVEPERRAQAYGYLYWAINLGFSCALVLAGFLAKLGYLTLFLGDGLTTLAYAGIVYLRVPETRKAHPSEAHHRAGGMKDALRDPVLMAFVFLAFLLSCIYAQSNVGLPLDLAAHGFPPSVFGVLLALNGIVIIAVQPFVAGPLRRFRRAGVLGVAALLTGLGFGWNAYATTVPGFGVGIVIWTLGEILNATFASAIVADLAPPALRGRYQGLYTMAWGLAAFAGPAGGAWVLSHFGAKTLWIGCVVVGVAIAVGHWMIAPARHKRLVDLGLGHTEEAATSA